jgi:hypothetical protein
MMSLCWPRSSVPMSWFSAEKMPISLGLSAAMSADGRRIIHFVVPSIGDCPTMGGRAVLCSVAPAPNAQKTVETAASKVTVQSMRFDRGRGEWVRNSSKRPLPFGSSRVAHALCCAHIGLLLNEFRRRDQDAVDSLAPLPAAGDGKVLIGVGPQCGDVAAVEREACSAAHLVVKSRDNGRNRADGCRSLFCNRLAGNSSEFARNP